MAPNKPAIALTLSMWPSAAAAAPAIAAATSCNLASSSADCWAKCAACWSSAPVVAGALAACAFACAWASSSSFPWISASPAALSFCMCSLEYDLQWRASLAAAVQSNWFSMENCGLFSTITKSWHVLPQRAQPSGIYSRTNFWSTGLALLSFWAGYCLRHLAPAGFGHLSVVHL